VISDATLVVHPSRKARGHWFAGTLDVDLSGSPSSATPSTRWAVDPLSMTPLGGATDSIRCAMPTCSPIAV